MIDDEIENFQIIFKNERSADSTKNSLSEVEIAIAKYRNHPSINVIIEKMEKPGNANFGFNFTTYEETVEDVNNLRSFQKADIPVKIAMENIGIVSYFLYHNLNNSLSCYTFPNVVKYTEVIPIHKRNEKTDEKNYPPISILPNISKVYERLMYKQIYVYLHTYFPRFGEVLIYNIAFLQW